MKITAIEIVGFGKWQQKKISFELGNQLLYGENEMGKSTIYQFIQAMLFGFPSKGKRKRDFTPKNGGAFGGRLWFEHPVYGQVQVDRFKEQNKGQAKVYYQQQVGDELILQKMLHPLTKKLFQEIFTFQQEQFTLIDKLDEEKLQTSMLAIGVTGSQDLLTYRAGYFKNAQELFKGKGTQPPLNQELAAYKKLQLQITAKEQQQQMYQNTLQQLKTIQRQLAELRTHLKNDQNQQLKVKEQQRNFSLYEELQALEIPKDIHDVSDEEQAQLENAFQEYTYLTEELQRLNQEIQLPNNKTNATSDLYPFYLKEEVNIQELLQQRYNIQQLVSEIDWLKTKISQNYQELAPLETKWDWSSVAPPRLPEVEMTQQVMEAKISNQVELQRLATQQQLIKEELTARETDLTNFESTHPEVFQTTARQPKRSNQKVKIAWLGGAIGLIAVSVFLPPPIRFVLWLAALSMSGVGIWPLFHKKAVPQDQAKKQWQEKLSHLDYLHEQLAANEAEMQNIRAAESEQVKRIDKLTTEYHLGHLNRVELWTNHREEVARFTRLVQNNEELLQQLKEKQTELQVFEQQIDYFVSRLPLKGKKMLEKIGILQRFVEEMEAMRFNHEAQATSYTKQLMRELKEKKQALLNRLQPLLIKFQIPTMEEIPQWLQQLKNKQSKLLRAKELTIRLEGIYPKKVTKTELEKQSQQLIKTVAEKETQLQQLQTKEQELLYQQQQMLADGSLDELYQKRASLKTVIEELALKWSGYQLAGQLLMDLLIELSEQQLPSLLKKASEYFSVLSNQRYTAIQIDEGLLSAVTAKHETYFIHELSTGTKDQLVMALRFAFLILQGEKMLCPIIIDDGGLHYDHRRKQQLVKLFAMFGEKYQVICFSSDQEMVSYYQELSQPIHYLKGGVK
jgi:uncharacterized protein YhaN